MYAKDCKFYTDKVQKIAYLSRGYAICLIFVTYIIGGKKELMEETGIDIERFANEDGLWWEEPEERDQRFLWSQVNRDWLAILVKKAKPFLSAREKEVLLLFLRGWKIIEIAGYCGLACQSIIKYQVRFLKKFGIVTEGLSTGSKSESPKGERDGEKAPLRFSGDKYTGRMLYQGKCWAKAERIRTSSQEWRKRNLRQFGERPVFPAYIRKPDEFFEVVDVRWECPRCLAPVKEKGNQCPQCRKHFLQ